MWIEFVILAVFAFSSYLIMVKLYSNSIRSRRLMLEQITSQEIVDRIENIKTFGREAQGWRNSFPSVLGTETTTLHIAKNFILVTGKSKFPFLFKMELQPFILSMEPDTLVRHLAYDRIYKPSNIRISNYGCDLELTIKPPGLLGQLTIHLVFENIGKHRMERLFDITNWR
jgi:hypothetical protein